MTKILNFALKIKGGGREGGTCEVLRPCHPPKIWNVHQRVIKQCLMRIMRESIYILNKLFSCCSQLVLFWDVLVNQLLDFKVIHFLK